ncbi:MAG: molybdate transport system substrate-binding protein [Pseudonocardiales bacterium]|nr:molybdate transport system substrate-binding protein [Pseudonocardiales bacterium]
MHRHFVAVIALTGALALASGCSSSTKSSQQRTPAGGGTSSTAAVSGTVNVFAASSLTEAFTTIATQFEAANPGVKIKLNFGASSDLANSINQGAPADVFASASPKNMQQVNDAGGASASTNFVKNFMEIAVPPNNPAGITGVADLAKKGVKVALCAAQVPCGKTAAQVFTNAKITVKPVTLEQNVKSTLTKVELGEVDAGVVYVTDVKAAGSKVKGIVIPAHLDASTEYPIAALTKAAHSAGAKAFVAYVLSPAAQTVLAAAGFEKP